MISMETKKGKKRPLMGYMSKTHPVEDVKVDQNTLKMAIKKARENERNWYRIQEDDDSTYSYNKNEFYDILY